jgi:biopolymer transport protein ExbD
VKLRRTPRVDATIPTASMADIAFLLIIFFMLTTVHEVDRTAVALPQSVVREESRRHAAYVVLARRDGRIVYKFSDGERTTVEVGGVNDIYLEASRVAHADATRQFVIKADADVRYLLVDQVLDALRQAGARQVVLLTRAKTERGQG